MKIINKILFLGSSNALKPYIIIDYLNRNKSLEFKELFLITDSITGDVNNLFVENHKYILESIYFSENDINSIKNLSCDLIICLGWPWLIPESVIINIGIPIINCHSSYLPDYRGSRAYMHYWANNAEFFGASIHFVTKKFDDGNILIRNKLKLFENETPKSIHYRVCELSAIQIPYAITLLENDYKGFKGDMEKARYFYKLEFDEYQKIYKKNHLLDREFLSDIYDFKTTDYKIVKNNAPKVMIVGGGILQYYLIEKVNELGYISIVVDGNTNAIGFKIADYYQVIDVKDEINCLKYAKDMKVNAVITGATDYSVLTVSYISEKLGLEGLSYDIAKILKNKYLVQELLYKKNISNKKTILISSKSDIQKKILDIQYPVIIKPCDGSGSRGVNKVNSVENLLEYINRAIENSVTQKCIIEPYIEGEEYGVESFVYDNKIYNLIVMKKIMTKPPYYAELGHINSLDSNINDKILEKVNGIIKALNINYGSVNMDLIVNDEDIYMVDIGARMGGNLIGSHMIPFSNGIDYMKIIINAALGKQIICDKKFNRAIASRIINLDTGVITYIDRKIIKKTDTLYKILLPRVGEHVHTYRNNLDGCGYIICSGMNEDDANSNAYNTLRDIQNSIEIEREQ